MTSNSAAHGTGGATAPVGIVGAGIVGLAVARQLASAGVPVVVFEKENEVATHQTGHNSGVVHAGIYYAPGSAKARMTRRGVSLLHAYCAERGLAYDERGKLVVARDEAETVKLRELERRSVANGVPGVQWLSGAELRELEPDVAGVAALLSPTTAIVDYRAITHSFGKDLVESGGELHLGTAVTRARRVSDDLVEIDTPRGAHTLSRLVICAGLQADLLAAAAGDVPAPEIIPFRGEYLRLRPHAAGRRAAAHLPGARPPVPVPRRAPHAARRRDGRPRPERRARAGPRGVPPSGRVIRRTPPAGFVPGILAAGPPALDDRGARDARVAVAARLPRGGKDLPALGGIGGRDFRSRWRARPGGRP
jgi:glycine/D-amino acid oxidase-like deaminating enzyme